jgi:hypothetical protein
VGSVAVEKKIALLNAIRMVAKNGERMKNGREVLEAAMKPKTHDDEDCAEEATLTVEWIGGMKVGEKKREREQKEAVRTKLEQCRGLIEKAEKEKEREENDAAQRKVQ